MTVIDFHIGLDLYLKILKSEIYGSLQSRDKDYFLNLAILDLIKEKTANFRDRYSMQENVPLARNFYSELGNLIVTKTYDTYDENYENKVTLALPRVDNVEVDSGSLLNGEQYKILERGSTNLSSVTSNTPLVNGTVFTVTATGSILPAWDGITLLERVSDPFMYIPFMIDCNLLTDISFDKGKVVKDGSYIAKTGALTSTKISTLFVLDVTASPIPIHVALSTGSFDGTTPTPITTLVKVKQSAVNLMLPTEYSILNADPASDKSNPVAIIHDDSIIIHCSNSIHSATLTYIKMPRRINYDLNINTDISPVLHKDIVDRAGKLILGLNNDPSVNIVKPQQ